MSARNVSVLVELSFGDTLVVRYSMHRPFVLPTFEIPQGTSELRALELGLAELWPAFDVRIAGRFSDGDLPAGIAGPDPQPAVYLGRTEETRRPPLVPPLLDIGEHPKSRPRIAPGLADLFSAYHRGRIRAYQ